MLRAVCRITSHMAFSLLIEGGIMVGRLLRQSCPCPIRINYVETSFSVASRRMSAYKGIQMSALCFSIVPQSRTTELELTMMLLKDQHWPQPDGLLSTASDVNT